MFGAGVRVKVFLRLPLFDQHELTSTLTQLKKLIADAASFLASLRDQLPVDIESCSQSD